MTLPSRWSQCACCPAPAFSNLGHEADHPHAHFHVLFPVLLSLHTGRLQKISQIHFQTIIWTVALRCRQDGASPAEERSQSWAGAPRTKAVRNVGTTLPMVSMLLGGKATRSSGGNRSSGAPG